MQDAQREIVTEIEIDAPPERVWAVLTDFPAYCEWNPFITRAEGRPEPGTRLRVRIHPPGGSVMAFRPKVLRAEPGRELRWLGSLLFRGLFDGEHAFTIEPIGGARVRLVQRECFAGVLVPLLASTLDKTRRGFEAMNRALKARAENASAG